MKRLRSSRESGMTLIEVMIALVLLMFGLAGVVDLFIFQNRQVGRTERLSRGTSLAYGYLAQVQAAGYSALEKKMEALPKDAASGAVSLSPGEMTRSTMDTDYLWNAWLSKEETPQGPRIKIKVTARWAPQGADAAQGAFGTLQREVMGYAVAR